MVDRLEDLDIESLGLGRVKGHVEGHEGIGKTLYTDSDGSVSEVRVLGLDDRVVVDVDDAVEVEGDNLGDLVKLLEVVDALLDVGGEGDRGEVADGDLVGGRVLDNLGT